MVANDITEMLSRDGIMNSTALLRTFSYSPPARHNTLWAFGHCICSFSLVITLFWLVYFIFLG